MEFYVQRIRNLTTERLHTEIGHIYEDLELLTGMDGIMTHMIPNIMRAMNPWLKNAIVEKRFWDMKYDTTHVGTINVNPMTKQEQKEFFDRYAKLPDPLANKKVVVINDRSANPS